MMEPLTALAAPVYLGALGLEVVSIDLGIRKLERTYVVVDFPGTAVLELGLGEPVPTGTTGVGVAVKVMVERLVVGTQVVTVMTEVLKEAEETG